MTTGALKGLPGRCVASVQRVAVSVSPCLPCGAKKNAHKVSHQLFELRTAKRSDVGQTAFVTMGAQLVRGTVGGLEPQADHRSLGAAALSSTWTYGTLGFHLGFRSEEGGPLKRGTS